MASRWAALASVPISRQQNRSSTRKLCPIQQLLPTAIGLNQHLPSCMASLYSDTSYCFSSASSVLRFARHTQVHQAAQIQAPAVGTMPDIRYEFKPRVNAALMSRFQNKTVLLVGQVLPSQQPGIGLLRAPDGQTVTVQLAPGSTFQQDFVEVEGTVVGQNRLQEANHHEIYEAVDMGVANEMCKISTMDFPGLFS